MSFAENENEEQNSFSSHNHFCSLTFGSKMREQKVIRANSDYEMSRAKSDSD